MLICKLNSDVKMGGDKYYTYLALKALKVLNRNKLSNLPNASVKLALVSKFSKLTNDSECFSFGCPTRNILNRLSFQSLSG